MSAKQLVIWKCDRCGAEESLVARPASGDNQPKDWHCLRLTRPPKADPTSANTTARHDLCPACTKVVEGILAMTLEPVEVAEDEEPKPKKKAKADA